LTPHRGKDGSITGMLIFDFDPVFEFIQSAVGGLAKSSDMQAIGLARDGKLVAGAVYEGFNGVNMWVHVAGLPGRSWLNREFLKAGFRYPFIQCGVKRLSGYVNASNTDARRFDEHVGFKEEARLRGAAPDGGDVIIYVMRKEDCRFLGAE
jgi:RimJ/RimL family protein N-acetyltransferase